MPSLLTTDEVKEALRVTRQTLSAWNRRGILKPVKISRVLRYKRDDVLRLLGETV